MATCDSTGIKEIKACSGKCAGGACGATSQVWVLAACEGMISLFRKYTDGHLELIPQGENSIAPSIEECRNYLTDASKKAKFGQLVLVGSANDIAWVQACLPETIVRHIIAEIKYPLVPNWFRTSPQLDGLAHALEHVLIS